jgi:hypothetical protein
VKREKMHVVGGCGTFVCPQRDGKKIKMRLLFLLQRKKTEIGEEEEDERVAGERKKNLRRTCGGVRERKK